MLLQSRAVSHDRTVPTARLFDWKDPGNRRCETFSVDL